MGGSEVPDRIASFRPGWDSQHRWTLRFVDRVLERSYLGTMAQPGRLRLGVACFAGAAIWAQAALLGPPLLKIPGGPVYVASLIAGGGNVIGTLLARRQISLPQAWAVAFITTAISAVCIIVTTWVTGIFPQIGAPALIFNGIFAFGVVRLASWLAAALGLFQIALFIAAVVGFSTGSVGAFQTWLVAGTMAMAAIGSRYLELAERTAFAQGQLVADLHRRIDRLFRQYLSPDVAQSLVDDPSRAELGGEVAEVSVLFADLRGYTPFSERTSPQEVVAMLNASFSSAVPAVFDEGGTIVQFVGDAMMAIFNAPLRQPDHALRACRAGLALQRSANDITGIEGRPQFRVGINTGPALVGNIGSAQLRNFSALGDTTNTAARLQTFAEPGRVVIGQRTLELVRDLVSVRPLGAPDLKGKSVKMQVYELLALHTPVNVGTELEPAIR